MWSCCGICGSYFVGLPPTVATKSCYSKALTQPSNVKSLSKNAKLSFHLAVHRRMPENGGKQKKIRKESAEQSISKTLTHYCQVNVKQSVYDDFSHVHYCCRQLSSQEQSRTIHRLKRRMLRVAEPYQK